MYQEEEEEQEEGEEEGEGLGLRDLRKQKIGEIPSHLRGHSQRGYLYQIHAHTSRREYQIHTSRREYQIHTSRNMIWSVHIYVHAYTHTHTPRGVHSA